jgi:hypothetical protein
MPHFGGAFLLLIVTECIYICMIVLYKDTSEYIYLTLTEKQELVNPNYLFVFKSRTTNLEVKFVLLNGSDVSPHKNRYNKFDIDVNTYFVNYQTGDYTYFVYEQTSTTNIEPNNLNLLESGLMQLIHGQNGYSYYQPNDIYKTRQ